MKTALAVLCMLTCAGALQGQTAAPATEAFVIRPAAVSAGASNLSLRFEANTTDLFSSSSTRLPELSFGAGVTLVEGSFRVLSPREAEARVNVDANTNGGVETAITFFSADGKKALRRERATLGITGPFSAGTSGIEVSVDEIRLVSVNLDAPQLAGAVVLSGGVNSVYELKPPAGTTLLTDNMPSASADAEDVAISASQVTSGGASFKFTVGNAAKKSVKITVTNIMLDTSGFDELGGTAGNLSSSISSQQLGTEAVLVVNAHTALDSLEGDEIPGEDETDDSDDDTDGETDSSSSDSTASPAGHTSFLNNPARNDDRDERRDGPDGPARTFPPSPGVAGPAQQPPFQPLPGEVNPGLRRPHPTGDPDVTPGRVATADGAVKTPAAGGTAPARDEGLSTGSVEGVRGPLRRSGANSPDLRDSLPVELAASPKLYFADASYKAISSVVLDGIKRGEHQGRVWIVLERKDISEKVDTVTVQVRVGGAIRDITLTETGAATGVFHSDAAGIEVAAVTSDNAGK